MHAQLAISTRCFSLSTVITASLLTMVYVNHKKFACESCIKGHRSSSCHHTDRPLFEIKKKGRPVSQCSNCRELRQSKKVHSKCTCEDNMERMRQEHLIPLSLGSKARRFIPIVPALPNGLRDVLESAKLPALPADSRQRVDSLLNPCDCRSVWNCNCRASTSTVFGQRTESDGLVTLAHVAALHCCSPPPIQTPSSPSSNTISFPADQAYKHKVAHSRPPSPPFSSRKRSKQNSHTSHIPGPDLPPMRFSLPSPTSHQIPSIPDFDVMPSISEIVSFAGSGCTCGVQCTCPGCVQHRGSEHAAKDHKDCREGCGTCVDHSTSALPVGPSSNFLDQFFARAAALPLPPSNRRVAFDLDPTDILTFRSLEANNLTVNLPKLDCCGGQCLCPNGQCSCGASCDGSCMNEHRPSSHPTTTSLSIRPAASLSCCASKRVADESN